MNDINFSRSFIFLTLSYTNFHYTDNRCGAASHYFALMLSGHARLVTESETVDVHEGDIFFIPKQCKYQSYWYGEPEIKLISLGFSCLPNFENKSYPTQTLPPAPEAVPLFHALSSASPLTAADIGRFYTLSGMLLPKMRSVLPSRSRDIVEKTREYLMRCPSADVAALAKSCTVSVAALYAAFKKSSDITLNQLRNQIVLEAARDILISTDRSIEAISDEFGFSSPSYFRKKFKAQFGASPREIRRQYRI